MVSWVWTYCKKIDNDFSSCNICLKRIARCGGTKSMICHLTAIHKITKDTNLADVEVTFMERSETKDQMSGGSQKRSSDSSDNELGRPNMQQRRSWVWNHFTCIDKEQSACHHCKHLMSHRHGTRGLIIHLKSIHSILKPENVEENDEEEIESNEEGEDNNAKQLLGNLSQKRSWAWAHYTIIDKQSASCNLCSKVLSCKDGTKGLIKHLEALHSIFKTDEPQNGNNTPRNTSTRSWIWPFYTVIDKLSARCNVCKKVLARGGGTSGLMKHLQSQHSVSESSAAGEGTSGRCDDNSWSLQENIFDNFVDFPCTVSLFSKENCYICNDKLSSCRNKLSMKTTLTATHLYEILESFTGIRLDRSTRNDSYICHACLNSMEQYDKWQYKSNELQRKMTRMFRKTHSNQLNVKQEPKDSEDEDEFNRKKDEDLNSEEDWWPNDSGSKRRRLSQSAPALDKTVEQKEAIEESYCSTCSRRFKNPALYEIHLATDHERSTGPFNCPKCSKGCNGLNSLKSHYLNHSLPRSLLCNKCGATFSKRRCLELHMQIHDDIRPYACTIPGCSKRFLHSFKLKCHLRVHSGEKIFECPYCPGRMFAQKWGKDLHIRKQHTSEPPSASGENEECKICGIRFNSKSKLKSHLENVHEVAPEIPIEKAEYFSESN